MADNLEFLTYFSTIEIALDLENALSITPNKIEGLWYLFKITDYIYQTTCPILIIISVDKEVLKLSIKDIIDCLGYIPEIKLSNKDLQLCLKNNGKIASIDLNNKLGFSNVEAKHQEYINSFIEYFKNKSDKISCSDIEQIKHFNCIDCDNITFVKSKAEALSKIYSNEVEQENTILQIKNNDISDNWVGIYWVYEKEKQFPPEESIAYIRECNKCGKNFIANWAKNITVCKDCSTKSSVN